MNPPAANRRGPARTGQITETLSGSELFLYDARGAELRVLNTSAMMIWSLCDGYHDAARMLDVLARIYPDVEHGQLATDIERTIEAFRSDGLVT